MKTKLTVVLAIVLSLNAIGSTNPRIEISKVFSVNNFGNFHVHRQHNSAALSWGFNAAVSHFIVQRSYDGNYFNTIDNNVGVSSGHWNKYLDNTVEPGTIYYKIIAVLTDGSREESPVATVRIVRHK